MEAALKAQALLERVIVIAQRWASEYNFCIMHHRSQDWYYCTQSGDYLAGIALCPDFVGVQGHDLPSYIIAALGKREYLTSLPYLHTMYYNWIQQGYSCCYCDGFMDGRTACRECQLLATRMRNVDDRTIMWLCVGTQVLHKDIVRLIARHLSELAVAQTESRLTWDTYDQ